MVTLREVTIITAFYDSFDCCYYNLFLAFLDQEHDERKMKLLLEVLIEEAVKKEDCIDICLLIIHDYTGIFCMHEIDENRNKCTSGDV